MPMRAIRLAVIFELLFCVWCSARRGIGPNFMVGEMNRVLFRRSHGLSVFRLREFELNSIDLCYV
jgi:hypothetical protein